MVALKNLEDDYELETALVGELETRRAMCRRYSSTLAVPVSIGDAKHLMSTERIAGAIRGTICRAKT